MQDVLAPLTLADYTFLIGLIESNVNLTDTTKLGQLLRAVEEEDTPANRAALHAQLEREIRYLGSSEVAYFTRYVLGQEPGVSFQEIVRDVARKLKVDLPRMATDRELVATLAERYATQQFAALSPEHQQRMLEDLGVDREKAARFVAKTAGVFAVPMLIEAFNVIVFQGLIRNVIFGTIAKIVGQQLARQLFGFVVGRFPWWLGWIGPAAWTLSIGWTALDLQGPATRKTVPIVLYLGLCAVRAEDAQPDEQSA